MTAIKSNYRLFAVASFVVAAFASKDLEYPDVVFRKTQERCQGAVAAWCDANQELQCGIASEFDEYGCSCLGNSKMCPQDCLPDSEIIEKTKYGIRCRQIPKDQEPNYVLKESHVPQRCENNAAVASWCDDYVNKHLECGLYDELDQYVCKCSGKHTNCPDECIGGAEPLILTAHSVLCKGIPTDSPNYILK